MLKLKKWFLNRLLQKELKNFHKEFIMQQKKINNLEERLTQYTNGGQTKWK